MQRRETGCGPCRRDRHCKCERCSVKRSPTGPTGPCCTGPTGPCCTGPTGPSVTGPTGFGVTGPTGVIGPTGPCCTGPTGASSVGGSFEVLNVYSDENQIVPPGGNVQFEETGANFAGITFVWNGLDTVTFLEPGVFQITYGLQVEKGVGLGTEFSGVLDGAEIGASHHAFNNLSGAAGATMETIKFVLAVPTTGSTFNIRNTGPLNNSLFSAGTGDISAFLVVDRLGDFPSGG